MTREERTLIDGMVTELASVLSTMVGSSGAVRQAGGGAAAGWTVSCVLRGAKQGGLDLSFERTAAVKLAGQVLAMDEDPSDADVSDTLKELVNQAIGAITIKPLGMGITFEVKTPVAGGTVEDMAAWFDLPVSDTLIVRLAGIAALTVGAVVATPPPPANGSSTGANGSRTNGSSKVPENLDVILDIDLPLSVRFGRAELTIDALTKLGPGSLIELFRSPDDPVDLLVNGKLVARGEVVVVGGNYGVRVHEVVSAAERIRSLE
jgi:flagellar motor switch protein FliN/FliY